jgi:hypothetical protein
MFHKILAGINVNRAAVIKRASAYADARKPNLQLLKILPILRSQYSCQFQTCQTKLVSVLQR